MAQSKAEIEAQKAYYQRANGPVIGKRSTLNTQPNKLFSENKKVGRIPAEFRSWEDAEQKFLEAVNSGLTPKEARKTLGLDYQNVLGNYYFDLVQDRHTGEIRGFNPRAVNEDFHPIAEQYSRAVHGNAEIDNFRAMLKDGWGDYKKKTAYDPMAPSARDEAVSVREYLTSFLGRGNPRDQATQIHRGHGFSASQSGGATSPIDLWAELGWANVHGHAGLAGNPRMHPDTMYDMNAADTAEAAYYNEDLNRRGLTINPRETQWPGAMIAVDENNNQIKSRSGPMSYDVGPAVEQNPGVTEAALPAQQRRRDELMAQMGASGPRQAINQANSKSIIMDSTQSHALGGLSVYQIPDGYSLNLRPDKGSMRISRTIKSAASTLPVVGGALLAIGAADKALAGDLNGAGADLVDAAADEFTAGVLTPTGTAPDLHRLSSNSFYDPRTNDVMTPGRGRKGLAVQNGKPVVVPYGSVAGKNSAGRRANAARKRGGRFALNIGPVKVTLPEFGFTEALKINK